METQNIQLQNSWKHILKEEFKKEYMQNIKTFLVSELKKNKIIYPHGKDIFNALNLTSFEDTKVVILGQDPYHGPNQAHGLCFSVQPGITPPPSLKNIYKELHQDIGFKIPNHGFLEPWTKQGVLLLNTVLTVEKSKPASHQGIGWENFTDKIIHLLNTEKKNLVFLLWGAHAQKKGEFLDQNKHLVLKSPHPSPFSANRGFFGSRHFSRTNEYLSQHNIRPIDWNIPEI